MSRHIEIYDCSECAHLGINPDDGSDVCAYDKNNMLILDDTVKIPENCPHPNMVETNSNEEASDD